MGERINAKIGGGKEREERKCNIVIKRINWEGDKDIEKGKDELRNL